jgi:dTDP-4-amino-4,6-dideoxygalactose transaminase
MHKIGVGYASVTELEKKYVMDALENNRLSSGPYVNRFEREFAKKHDNRYGVMCNSGTSAIHIALETLKETEGWDPGAEILVPALTFISTSNACIHAGLTPVFVDVDPKTYTMDASQIEHRITEKTKALLPVHVFGLPCEMDAITRIARKHGLKIIEDCADAHFAAYQGRPVGSFGDMAAFSTYVAHTITTGAGGMVLTNDPRHAEILRSLVAHGRSCTCEVCAATDPDSVCPKRSNAEMDRRFLFERMGYSYRVGEIEGALGLAQLERCGQIMAKRKANAARLTKGLETFEDALQLPRFPAYMEHTFMMYPILITASDFSRKDMTDFLERGNIETRPMFPLLNQPVYQKIFGDIEDDFPVSQRIGRNGFYVGCHHGLEEAELAYMLDVFQTFFRARDGRKKTGR